MPMTQQYFYALLLVSAGNLLCNSIPLSKTSDLSSTKQPASRTQTPEVTVSPSVSEPPPIPTTTLSRHVPFYSSTTSTSHTSFKTTLTRDTPSNQSTLLLIRQVANSTSSSSADHPSQFPKSFFKDLKSDPSRSTEAISETASSTSVSESPDLIRLPDPEAECRDSLPAGKGMLTNPGYPSYFEDKTTCTWVIESPGDNRNIVLLFKELDLSPQTTLAIYNTEEEGVNPIWGYEPGESPINVPIGCTKCRKVWIKLNSEQAKTPRTKFLLRYAPGSCEEPTVPANAVYEPGLKSFLSGDVVSFGCEEGYVLNDTNPSQPWQAECQETGSWSIQGNFGCIEAYIVPTSGRPLSTASLPFTRPTVSGGGGVVEDPDGSDNNRSKTGIIVGSIVAAVVVVAALSIGLILWYRRKHPARLMGREVAKFSNPAYHNQRSMKTLSLVVENGISLECDEDGNDIPPSAGGHDNQAYVENEYNERRDSDVNAKNAGPKRASILSLSLARVQNRQAEVTALAQQHQDRVKEQKRRSIFYKEATTDHAGDEHEHVPSGVLASRPSLQDTAIVEAEVEADKMTPRADEGPFSFPVRTVEEEKVEASNGRDPDDFKTDSSSPISESDVETKENLPEDENDSLPRPLSESSDTDGDKNEDSEKRFVGDFSETDAVDSREYANANLGSDRDGATSSVNLPADEVGTQPDASSLFVNTSGDLRGDSTDDLFVKVGDQLQQESLSETSRELSQRSSSSSLSDTSLDEEAVRTIEGELTSSMQGNTGPTVANDADSNEAPQPTSGHYNSRSEDHEDFTFVDLDTEVKSTGNDRSPSQMHSGEARLEGETQPQSNPDACSPVTEESPSAKSVQLDSMDSSLSPEMSFEIIDTDATSLERAASHQCPLTSSTPTSSPSSLPEGSSEGTGLTSPPPEREIHSVEAIPSDELPSEAMPLPSDPPVTEHTSQRTASPKPPARRKKHKSGPAVSEIHDESASIAVETSSSGHVASESMKPSTVPEISLSGEDVLLEEASLSDTNAPPTEIRTPTKLSSTSSFEVIDDPNSQPTSLTISTASRSSSEFEEVHVEQEAGESSQPDEPNEPSAEALARPRKSIQVDFSMLQVSDSDEEDVFGTPSGKGFTFPSHVEEDESES